MIQNVYSEIFGAKQDGRKLLTLLIDPDKIELKGIPQLVGKIRKSPVTHIMIGGSLLSTHELEEIIVEIKSITNLPVVLFPGNVSQVTKEVDAMLFLSMVSGRNPEYLIGQHVQAAPVIKRLKIETIATGYMLIESGASTSVSYISNTQPIPRDKKDIAVATALAAEMLGMQALYLEGGSGAKHAVPLEMVAAVSTAVDIPIIVGGGIRDNQTIQKMYDAGATMVVIGTAFEENSSFFEDK